MVTLLAKVWFDLVQDKSRTLQIVMVIALGAIGIGLVIGGRNLVAGAVSDSWQAAGPPHIQLRVTPPLTLDQVEYIESIEGVVEVEGLYSSPIEWRIAGSDDWQTGVLQAREDYQNQRMSLDELLSGEWPQRNELAAGQISVGSQGVFEGDRVDVRFNETVRTFDVVGQINSVAPAPVFAETLYADRRTFARITGRDAVNTIQVRGAEFDQAEAEAIDLAIQDYFEDIDVDSVGVQFPFQERIVPPDTPPAAAILNAIFLLLGLIGVIVVILGIFLVYNSVSAIVTQQVNQIGVMKAIGADAWRVVWSYLLLILAYGVLAAVISIPIGAAAAFGLQGFFASFLNLEIDSFAVDRTAVAMQVAISLVAPLIAALVPLVAGMRITVREAISTYGISGSVGFVDKAIVKVRGVPYTLLLTIGNTFRNRSRVIIIEVALIVSGAIFMMVMGVNDATNYTFGSKLSSIHNYQVTHALQQTERIGEIEQIAQSVDGVTAVESWLILSGSARPVSQAESEVTDARITVFGQPADTALYRPDIQEGRWLRPEDTNAAVVSQQVAEQKQWRVGDVITLDNGDGREFAVEIVGLLFDPATNTSVHVSRGVLQREWGAFDLANTVWLQTERTDAAAQTAVAEALDDRLAARGIDVAPSSTFGENTIAGIVESTGEGYGIIIQLLAVMAVVIALVGGVGLSGIISLSVIERRREVGVMRAIGASSWQVIRLFIGEGVLLGVISWLIAFPISIVVAYAFTTRGLSLALNQQLVYQFTPLGAGIWLVIITVLAIIASILPARGAAKISVRESLSYQ